MKLQAKLGTASAFMVGTLALAAVTLFLGLRNTESIASMVIAQSLPAQRTAAAVRSHLLEAIFAEQGMQEVGLTPAAFATYQSHGDQHLHESGLALAELYSLNARYDLGPDHDRIQASHEAWSNIQSLNQRLTACGNGHSAGNSLELSLLQSQLAGRESNFASAMEQIADSQLSIAQSQTEHLHRSEKTEQILVWTLATGLGIMGSIIFMVLGARLTPRIQLVMQRAHAISIGDLTGEPLDIGHNDEIGNLAIAMQQMQTNLARVIGTVMDTAGALTTNAASMRTASDKVHRRIEQQGQQTQQTASAMQEMSASIAEVSRHTQTAAESARNAAETAREGGCIVRQVLENMHSIASAVNDTSSTVALLGDDSHRISLIVTVIDEIARKTNLLALNAAIEAARAGEQGRGLPNRPRRPLARSPP